MQAVSFNIPYTIPESIENIKQLIEHPSIVNQGNYINKCKDWFESNWEGYTAFLTSSCTRALEMIALGINISAGDEIILSPFTYVGVGNAFANYGARLVFVDIHKQTMNINEDLIEAAITDKTRAVIAMHYAGYPCHMERIREICNQYDLILIEDNAQGIHTFYNNSRLGTFGDFSCISFDMQKNISCNEGGVLLCRNEWLDAIDVAYNNGTNKTAFSKGLVDKYEWVRKGSKFIMSEYTAAVLYPLLEKSEIIINERRKVWRAFAEKILSHNRLGQFVPQHMLEFNHNAHILYLKFKDTEQRNNVLDFMNARGIPCLFHYIPLDASEEGKKHILAVPVCPVSEYESSCLLRLPMHNYLTDIQQQFIVNTLLEAIEKN